MLSGINNQLTYFVFTKCKQKKAERDKRPPDIFCFYLHVSKMLTHGFGRAHQKLRSDALLQNRPEQLWRAATCTVPWWKDKTNEGVQHTRALLETRLSGDDSRISCRPRWHSCSAKMKGVFIVCLLQSSKMFESASCGCGNTIRMSDSS